MDNFIKDLIALDKKAQEKLRLAEQTRAEAKAQVEQDREAAYQRELAKVQQQLEAAKSQAKAQVQTELGETQLRFEQAMAALDARFAANKTQWVGQIVARCLGSVSEQAQ